VSRNVAWGRAGEPVERVSAGAERSGVGSLAGPSPAVVIGHIARVTSTGTGGIDRGSGPGRTAAGEGGLNAPALPPVVAIPLADRSRGGRRQSPAEEITCHVLELPTPYRRPDGAIVLGGEVVTGRRVQRPVRTPILAPPGETLGVVSEMTEKHA
jgi:hypothetical protein